MYNCCYAFDKMSMEKDILPISLTLVMAKTFELLVLKNIDPY